MGKNTGKVREFCQSGKVGTLLNDIDIHEIFGTMNTYGDGKNEL